MASAASRVRNQIRNFGAGVVFTTRQLLKLGTRNAVDHTLSRLVRQKIIRRVAAGVFILVAAASHTPSADEIAIAKAAAFNRRILGQKTVQEGTMSIRIYEIDGCRSSFKSIHGRLFFIPVTAEKWSCKSPDTNLVFPGLMTQPSCIHDQEKTNSFHVSYKGPRPTLLHPERLSHLKHLPQEQARTTESVEISNNNPFINDYVYPASTE
jgi:hypothetical protein